MRLQSTRAPPEVLSVTTSRLLSRFMSSIWGPGKLPQDTSAHRAAHIPWIGGASCEFATQVTTM